jgi:hypothetical protein
VSNLQKIEVGTGMPSSLYLDEFGSQVWSAFGSPPYLVGSALHGKQWRDVDVRLILADDEYAAMGLGNPKTPISNGKWVSLCMAYSALGKHMTGLPIDFQIQQRTFANERHPGPRSAIGCIDLRFAKPLSAEVIADALADYERDMEQTGVPEILEAAARRLSLACEARTRVMT